MDKMPSHLKAAFQAKKKKIKAKFPNSLAHLSPQNQPSDCALLWTVINAEPQEHRHTAYTSQQPQVNTAHSFPLPSTVCPMMHISLPCSAAPQSPSQRCMFPFCRTQCPQKEPTTPSCWIGAQSSCSSSATKQVHHQTLPAL